MKSRFLFLRKKLGDATLSAMTILGTITLGVSLIAIVLLAASCSPRTTVVDGISYQKVKTTRGRDYIMMRDVYAWNRGDSVVHFRLEWYKPINIAGK